MKAPGNRWRLLGQIDWSPVLALAVVCLIWGYNWVVMKHAVRYAGPLGFSAMRFAAGTFSLLPVLLWSHEGLRISRAEAPLIILLALLLVANFGCTTGALVVGGAGKTGMIVCTMPFWALILSRLWLKEVMRGWHWATIALALGGLLMLADPFHGDRSLASEALALAAGFFWGASVTLVKAAHARHGTSIVAMTFWQIALGFLGFVLCAAIVPERPVQWSRELLYYVLYSGVLATSVAWLLFYRVVRQLPAGVAALGTLMSPVLGALFGWWELDERPTLLDFLGMTSIACALAFLIVAPFVERRRQSLPTAK